MKLLKIITIPLAILTACSNPAAKKAVKSGNEDTPTILFIMTDQQLA